MQIKQEQDKVEFILSIFFACLLFMIVLVICQLQIESGRNDYSIHGNAAISIYRSNFFQKFREDPHCLWHLFVKGLWFVSKTDDLGFVAGCVTGCFVSITYVLTVTYIRHFCTRGAAIMGFIVSTVGPLYFPWINQHYYVGTGTPNVWHNPTNIAVKPFAVIIFAVICGLLSSFKTSNYNCSENKIHSERNNGIVFLILSILIFFSVIAKPSFIMAFIPALGVYILFCLFSGEWKNIRNFFLICVSFVPGVLVMLFQFLTFFGDSTDAGIGVELFRVSKRWTDHPYMSSMLGVAFPLVYIFFNFRTEIKKIDTQLSLLFISVGWIMGNLLYETGPREGHGNMGWAYQIALYILWMVELSHFLKDIIELDKIEKHTKLKYGVLVLLLSFHFLLGIKYIIDLLTLKYFW